VASESHLATAEELEAIARLREDLKAELTKVEAEGKNYPHTTGDIFFTRVLRGNDGDVEKATTWYRTFVELREKFKLDGMHSRFDVTKEPWTAATMPHSAEVMKYCNHVFDEEKYRTPQGHLVWYEACGDRRLKDMLTAIGLEKYIEFVQCACERRTSVIDALSRSSGKMVRILRILDFEATGLWMLNKEVKKIEDEHLQPVLIGTSCETIQLLFFINFPRVFKKIADAALMVFPKRLVARVRILGRDYLQDPEYLREVGGALSAQLTSQKRCRSDADDPMDREGSGKLVGPGVVAEKMVMVESGQRVNWTFRVGSVADGDQTLTESRTFAGKVMDSVFWEATDLLFSVSFWGSPPEDVYFSKPKQADENLGGTLPQHPHRLTPEPAEDNVCDLCGGQGTAFCCEECAETDSYEVCQACWDKHGVGLDKHLEAELELNAPTAVDAAQGDVVGSVSAPRAGMVVLRWSNYRSWIRGRTLSSYKLTVS